jgi:hypothetical protein
VALLSAAIVGVVATAGRGQEPQTRAVSSHRYIVRPGDTLWSIARLQVGVAGDPRPLIQEIRTANALDVATLTPGAALVLP